MTSVPSITWTNTGPQLPQETDILTGVQADQNAAFGGGLNPGLSTPQGQLAQSLTAIIGDKNSQIAYITEQVNPDYADGAFQDAIGRIYFLNRQPATSTVVTCTCTGLSGTVIPVGARVQDTSGNIYLCTGAGTIPSTGTIDLEFANQNTGPIPCPMLTVSTIYQSIPGWDTVTNAAAGVLGNVVESRADFEYRRQQSVAINAHGSLQSIYAAVFAVAGVTDVYATENVTDSTVNVGPTSYPLLPHSVYVAVAGGASADIANAIWSKKDVGCNMNGNQSVMVSDTSYSVPQPTYTIKYEQPASTPINFTVQLANNGVPPDYLTLVQNAIAAAFSGSDGGSRARIGSTLYASRYYPGIAAIGTNIEIVSVQLGTSTPNQNSLTLGIDQVPTIGTITVTLV